MSRLRQLMPTTLLIAGALLFAADDLSSQDLHPSRRPSPLGVAKTHLGDAYVKVMYGRPYMRGRDIFGQDAADASFLVPYGALWRLGANEATEITVTGPIRVAGNPLPAGTYSMFAVPGPEAWTIHFSPQLGLDGTGMLDPETGAFTADVYDPSRDVLVIEASSVALDDAVEQFTVAFESSEDGAVLTMSWERTQVRIPLAPARGM